MFSAPLAPVTLQKNTAVAVIPAVTSATSIAARATMTMSINDSQTVIKFSCTNKSLLKLLKTRKKIIRNTMVQISAHIAIYIL